MAKEDKIGELKNRPIENFQSKINRGNKYGNKNKIEVSTQGL